MSITMLGAQVRGNKALSFPSGAIKQLQCSRRVGQMRVWTLRESMLTAGRKDNPNLLLDSTDPEFTWAEFWTIA